ncbi:MAG: hypothetical protein P4L40_13830 [Terracidiphilus sp.]|nr:hypothetical protein [Terracidiphilus sp.]
MIVEDLQARLQHSNDTLHAVQRQLRGLQVCARCALYVVFVRGWVRVCVVSLCVCVCVCVCVCI